MKLFWWAALILVLYAHPSHAVLCSDGVSRATASNLCPGLLFNNGTASVEETSFASIGENDTQGIGGTRYIYVSLSAYPPGCSAANYTHPATTEEAKLAKAQCARHDLIKSGSGASIHTSETLVYAGSYSKVVTGATAGTTYYVHEQIHGGACDDYPNYTQNCRRPGAVSLVTTTEVTTDEADTPGGGEGTEMLSGAQRYIKNGGNDLSDGLSDSTAWASLSKCSSSLPASTDCNLKSGSTWTNETLSLEHGGTSSDYAVVRTYQMDGADHIATPVGGTRAIIKGGALNDMCLAAGTCDYREASINANGLSNEYDEYFYIAHTADYSRVSNIAIQYVQTSGMRVQGSWPTMGSLHHVIIEDNLIQNVGLNGITIENGVQDFIFRRNTISLGGTCAQQRQMGGGNISYLCPTAIFPAGGVVARSYPARALVEANDIYRFAGEGFDCNGGTTYVIFRQNRLAQTQSSGLYPDGCNHVVMEANISVGPRGEDFGYYNGSGAGFGGGMTSQIEDWQGAGAPNHTDVHVRNNLTIETGWGVVHGMFTDQLGRNKQLGGYIVGNTSIDAIDSDYYIDPPITNSHVSALYYHNNIGWNEARGGAACVMPNISDVTVSYNHSYVSYTSYTKCNGTNNSTGDPLLDVSSYATWGGYNYASMPTFANAKPQIGSPANNTGTPLTSTILTYTNYGFAAEQMADVLSGAITLDNWAKALYYDALNVTRSGSTPDKGAVERL